MGMTRQYVEQLSDSIGPRPVASDTERDAAEWIRQRFVEQGLNTTIQDFDTVRSLSGAYLIYALVSVASVVLLGLAHKWAALCWLLWGLILVSAVLAWLDFSGRGALSRVFPKGPSQNIVGRYAPLARPGEEAVKVVLVAHYDTDNSTLLSSEGLATPGRWIVRLARGAIVALPVFALAFMVPLTLLKKLQPRLYPYNWYALMVICVPVLLMLLNLLIASLIRRYSPGANNNASGVAALLSICEGLAESQNPASSAADGAGKFSTGALGTGAFSTGTFGTGAFSATAMQPPVTQDAGFATEGAGFDATFDFDVKPQAAEGMRARRTSGRAGSFAPAPASARDDEEFATTPLTFDDSAPQGAGADFNDVVAPYAYAGASTGAYGSYEDYDARATFADAQPPAPAQSDFSRSPFTATMDFGFSEDETDPGASYEESLGGLSGSAVLGADVIGGSGASSSQFTDSFSAVSPTGESAPDYGAQADDFAAYAAGVSSGQITRSDAKRKKGGFFGRRKKQDEFQAGDFGAGDQPSEWLGVDTEYDAREEGRKIGSWDNFPSDGEDFDDGLSWKGGAGEGDLIEDGGYAATQAARIRRKISETLTAGLANKELWFVATSAHYVHSRGIRTFLEDYREELRGALFINLEALGSGDLYWSVSEQAGKTYKSSARLTAMARRVARERNIRAKPYKKGKLRTEAGWALADGRKAVSIVRLTEAGVPFAEGSTQDVAGRLAPEKIDEAVEFVISLIQGL
ncbi:MAG: hypothetical protein FWC54_04225 [Actinomycetia bacterium]|nr:hypothetical protein [Actinomycetes bacterium]